MNLLANKNYLIIGATTDIGIALSKALAAEKAHCILLDKESKKLDALYDELIELGAASVLLCPLDRLSAIPDHYPEIAHHLAENYACLDGLIFSEGAFIGLTPLEHLDVTKWLSILQVNLNTPFVLCQALLPLLKKSAHARILFTEGVAANPNKEAYWGPHCVAEHGIQGLAAVINAEYADTSVRAHIINPGPVKCTQRLRAFPAEDPSRLPEISSILSLYLDKLA